MKSSGFTVEINGKRAPAGSCWAPDGGTEQDQQDDVSADEGLFLRGMSMGQGFVSVSYFFLKVHTHKQKYIFAGYNI